MKSLPLQALYYFYIAAENGSFKKAAEQLFVTPGAMSQQIRHLEDLLDVSLFERQHRKVVLSDAGETLFPYAKQAFQALQEGVKSVGQDPDPNTLTVSTLNSFAQQWLVPKLGTLKQDYPDLSIKLMPSNRRVDFNQDPVDLCIRFGLGDYEGLHTEHLMDDIIYPVCHPLYKEQLNIKEIDDLERCSLLEDIYPDLTLDKWLAITGASFSPKDSTNVYSGSHLVVEGALAVQGVGFVRHSIAWRYIKQGLLVRLFDVAVRPDFRYFLCAPPANFKREKVQQFSSWVRSEVDAFLEESRLPNIKILDKN